MTGQDLINFIEKNPELLFNDVSKVIRELLDRGLICPSTLIDAQVKKLTDEQYKVRCHYEDACVSSVQLFNGLWEGDMYEEAKNRFLYNTSFSKCFPNMNNNNLTEEQKKYWSDFFQRTYGFRPEEDIDKK